MHYFLFLGESFGPLPLYLLNRPEVLVSPVGNTLLQTYPQGPSGRAPRLVVEWTGLPPGLPHEGPPPLRIRFYVLTFTPKKPFACHIIFIFRQEQYGLESKESLNQRVWIRKPLLLWKLCLNNSRVVVRVVQSRRPQEFKWSLLRK